MPTLTTRQLRQSVMLMLLALLCLIFVREPQDSFSVQNVASPEKRPDHNSTHSNLYRRWEKCPDWAIADLPGPVGSIVEGPPDQPTTQQDWCQQSVIKGRYYNCMLHAKASNKWVPEAKYKHYSLLEYHGWQTEFEENELDITMGTGLRAAFKDPDISEDSCQWTRITQDHLTDTIGTGTAANPQFPSTGAIYENYINREDGTIVFNWNFGPDYYADRKRPPIPTTKRVPLKQLSDVFGLELFRRYESRGQPLSTIKHVIRYNVVNDKTRDAMRTVLDREQLQETDKWPGHVFKIDTPQAKFLLNTPNAKVVSWLLGQNKDRIGEKIVDGVRIFNCPYYDISAGCLYFHVADRPAGTEPGGDICGT